MFDRRSVDRYYGMSRHPGWFQIAAAVSSAGLALYLGIGFGVAGGAHLRDTGVWFAGNAEQFWLIASVFCSALLAIPRSKGAIALSPMATYLVSLCLGYAAGYQWGNFVGWRPD